MAGLENGKLALIIGARTEKGRVNIGKVVTLEKYVPINTKAVYEGRVYTPLYANCWIVTGDIVSYTGDAGFGLYAVHHLMPLEGDSDQFTKEQDKELEKV